MINDQQPIKTDWVFFSSPKSLDLYIDNFGKPKAKIGVIGSGTLSKAKDRRLEVSFIPKSTETEEIIGEFARVLQTDETVLYPKGQRSFNRLNDALNENQVVDFVFYTTESTDFPQAKSDHLLFTSPSNVDAYFSRYHLKKDQRVYAIGNSTAEALIKKGLKPSGIANEPGEKGFWEIIA